MRRTSNSAVSISIWLYMDSISTTAFIFGLASDGFRSGHRRLLHRDETTVVGLGHQARRCELWHHSGSIFELVKMDMKNLVTMWQQPPVGNPSLVLVKEFAMPHLQAIRAFLELTYLKCAHLATDGVVIE